MVKYMEYKLSCNLQRDFPDVKILAPSGGSRTVPMGFLSEAKKMGAHYILNKSFKPIEFVETIRNPVG